MDSITQIVLGGGIAGAIAHKQLGRNALIIGAVLATIPDLDVLLPTTDVITHFTEHRSFSHSLFILFPFSFVCYAFLRLKFKANIISNQRLFWLSCLVLTTHPILDSFTSYGTQLFWPLAIPPISIASIFAVDPLYTLPLLVGCIYLWRNNKHLENEVNDKKNKARRINCIGLMLSSGYLLLGLILQTLMLNKVEAALQATGISKEKIFISPLYPSLNWWGAIVIDESNYYDVKINVLTSSLQISERQDLGNNIIDQPIPTLTSLNWFTNGFIRLQDIEGKLIVTDLRMKTGQIGYAFKFVLAEKDNQQWKVIPPLRM